MLRNGFSSGKRGKIGRKQGKGRNGTEGQGTHPEMHGSGEQARDSADVYGCAGKC